MLIDCESGANLLMSATGADTFTFDTVVFNIGRGDYYQIPCTSTHDLVLGPKMSYILLSLPHEIFNINFMQSLAGLFCGLMVGWTIVKFG